MTRFPWAGRLARATLAFWFTLAVVGSPTMHRCPAHASHSDHARHRGGAPVHDPSRCTCLGSCCAITLAQPGAPGALPSGPTLQALLEPGFRSTPSVSARNTRLLPFATAPPTLSV
jgi:hypothetical protein